MTRSEEKSDHARETVPPSTPKHQVRNYEAIPPSSNRSFLSSVVDLFQQAKTNATSEFDQLYHSFSVPDTSKTPQSRSHILGTPSKQRIEKKYLNSTPRSTRQKRYTTSLTPHFERQRIGESPRGYDTRKGDYLTIASTSQATKQWLNDVATPIGEVEYQPNRSLTKVLEQAAVDQSILPHSPYSHMSASTQSRTRLDFDELDDELHRVQRLDRNLDIVRKQVHALYAPGILEYDQNENSFVSRKSSHFDTNILGDEPTTHETLFTDPPHRSTLMRTSTVIGPDSDKYAKPTLSTKDNEISFVSRSNELPTLPISPVPRARTLSQKRTPLKSSPFNKSVRNSRPSPYKSQNHPERLSSRQANESPALPPLLQELANIRLRPTNTIRSPNGTLRTNKYWDEIHKSNDKSDTRLDREKEHSLHNISSLKGVSLTESPLRMHNHASAAEKKTHITSDSNNLTNYRNVQRNSTITTPSRSLHDELLNAGTKLNQFRASQQRRSTILRAIDESEVFSEDTIGVSNSQKRHKTGTNIIPGDEYTFQGQRFRIEEADG
ncbi:hypothetical protein NQZ79_g4134 [Umbelopsis isabellina]|nr:hypothetical protein NQZ79_g4134 [Umbelopsis isabellina]